MQDRSKRIIRIAVVIGIALGSGHVVQSNTPRSQLKAIDAAKAVPKNVVELSAEIPETTTRIALTGAEELPLILPEVAARPHAGKPAMLVSPDARSAETAGSCDARLELSAEPGAMIDVNLSAPCRPQERVVIRHAGLAITYRTNAVGDLYATIPALTEDGTISVLFKGGSTVEGSIRIAEADAHHRFGVQWLGQQAFEVNAFEDGADFGQPGHVSAADPHRPGMGLLANHGFLSVLGDDQVDTPLLAEIYTFPSGKDDVPVLVEAAVTEQTCNLDLVGEIIESKAGKVTKADLSVTMPGCEAIGQYLELKNLRPDTKLAAAD